ncbi:Hypothetical protein c2465 [Escherichia coli CFT073]|uniref:Uncharacterized protein n=1 Tax=Escherichia coli O6:H1 (strain CFT073 / ATCC 700928 / UPEC) TaxID=199310 RepID=A0A0H2V8H5_ECOL6|nr:Hypothetical protein c2465 [Escherichia coli CFT073]
MFGKQDCLLLSQLIIFSAHSLLQACLSLNELHYFIDGSNLFCFQLTHFQLNLKIFFYKQYDLHSK